MRTFLIVGSSRSGTSLTAGLLHNNGICMGDTFTGNAPQNPHGFFEDLVFTNFNVNWLRDAGGSFSSPPPREALEQEAERIKAHSYLKHLVGCHHADEWGVKDPRMVWLWPWYFEVFRDRNPHLIVTRRNLKDIAESLWAARWVGCVEQGVGLAAQYDERLSEIVKEVSWPVLELHFEDWWKDFERQKLKLEAFIGREMSFDHFKFHR